MMADILHFNCICCVLLGNQTQNSGIQMCKCVLLNSVVFLPVVMNMQDCCISHHRNLFMPKDKYIHFYRDSLQLNCVLFSL